VAICPSRSSQTYEQLRKVGRFCVNVLGEDQHDLSDQFARTGSDRFTGIKWSPSPTGAPVLEHILAWIDCEIELEHVAGDHYVVLARVVDLGPAAPEASRRPLLYFRGDYHRLVPIDGPEDDPRS
jgi:3-hydroxy-9,10-secoandrosta-1,3,5(10)-triene-9,17-dione monooxygenase reductase component